MLNILKTDFKSFTDEKLMQAIQNGDCKAFDELYFRYNQRLYYYFYRMLGHEHQVAEDFMQDLFLKVIQKPHYYDSKRPFSTWVFSIAHNMCKNEYRSRQVRSIVNSEENPDRFICDDKPSEEKDKNIDLIFSELNKMDDSHKTAFLLKYREGFTIDEISEIMELPKGTVKSRLFYARKKLQQQLSSTPTS
ncbi:MAG: RNA polymerase sigma factor [Salinivirgaceae bacterium]|jgi:RNA polymerase sigma-70 factor (ECF subfamily)|nr:RNA polymerase sigma factor [Salinivirgaceae bacterium]